ncbi:MAG: helix-turn-helix domain-containing protein [Oscillospiraceae bacterium]|nr:helix-turn-helix domain-containing protein [Oscillospiraceae bacterium]
MTNHIFSEVIQQMKAATDRQLGVIDAEGTVVACSDAEQLGAKYPKLARVVALSDDQAVNFSGKTVRALANFGGSFDYAVFVNGDDEIAHSLCLMAHVALNCTKIYYEEKHDKTTFVKNIITDNILPGDIYIRAKELHFPAEQHYAVFLIRQTGSVDVGIVDVLQNLYPDRQQDFVISVNETDVAVVKSVNGEAEQAELMAMATGMEETIKGQLFAKTIIGIGGVAEHLRGLADSFKEAQIAIEVGKVFDTEKTVITYENLGIGRLIYQLPTTLCEIFLDEVFKKNSIDTLDQETLFTINKFFENNLNVSETSRKLFVHRNTLVYRLEKIKKLTGLDLREFDHAIIFKVALMVKKYLASRDNKMF